MTVIGIASDNGRQIGKIIKNMFSAQGKKTCIADSGTVCSELIEALEKAGVEYVVVALKKGEILSVYLDILILETSEAIGYELVKCISPETRLIYNRDNKQMPEFVHPNAISYGMSYNAEVTASSVDDKQEGVGLVYCLKRPVKSFGGTVLCECEMPVRVLNEAEIDEILAAVTCGLLCDLPVNILINI